MDGSIGDGSRPSGCNYGDCRGPVRVRVVAALAFGDLRLCLPHWREAEDLIVASSTFLWAQVDIEPSVPAPA